MELWIPITIAAAFMQNLRFALQKHLKGRLSTFGVTYARFIWAAPLAVGFVFLLVWWRDAPLPATNGAFFWHAVVGGVTQIIATALLVALFGLRNFAVGVSFSKTETIQTAIIGFIVLGEAAGIGAIAAILISMVGVILISVEPGRLMAGGLMTRSAVIGLASGAFFGVAAVSYRAASLSLDGGDFLERAAMTLAVVTVIQTAMMTAYLVLREPGEVTRVIKEAKLTALVGFTGMAGSLGWFTAMTLQNAAYVRALGQIELVFTFIASFLIFGERSTRRELAGIALIVLGILLLLIAR